MILTGRNGSGKTNILEAISLFAPGRGLRGARIGEMTHCHTPQEEWAVSMHFEHQGFSNQLGTGRSVNPDSGRDTRRIRINGADARQQTGLSEILSIAWLTPQMDGIFLEGTSERRKFVDRMTYSFLPTHAAHVSAYERAMRERNRLLSDRCTDNAWLHSLETKMSELAVAIAAARLECIDRINGSFISDASASFPQVMMQMTGAVEALLREKSATEAEDTMREQWSRSRESDAISGRTLVGVHRSDLDVIYMQKNMPAGLCSTGEQKAILLSIVLAHVRAKLHADGTPPLLLLDETVAHLDVSRRGALFEMIQSLGVQAWMSGTDAVLFDALRGKATFLSVDEGTVEGAK